MTRSIFIPFRDGALVQSETREIPFSVEPFVRHKSVVDFGATVGVTRRQNDALEFIRSYIGEHGYAPSYREIGAAIGVGRSRVAEIIRGLDKRGHIRRLPGKARAIEVAGAAA